jgi:hypothetical protein
MASLISESMDRRLGMTEYVKLSLHRLVCAWCDRYFRQIRFLRRSIQLRMAIATEDTQPTTTLTTEARQRISESLTQSSDKNCRDRV